MLKKGKSYNNYKTSYKCDMYVKYYSYFCSKITKIKKIFGI